MLRTTDDLRGMPLRASDGDIGRCKDFLFDDRHWTIRYMVADTGKWLPGRRVLVSPISLAVSGSGENRLNVELTRRQIEEAPSVQEDIPVSRQHEIEFHQYYGYGPYWYGNEVWGAWPTPVGLREPGQEAGDIPTRVDGDPHLRSIEEVTGYGIQASDGDLGHVEDFLVDDETWALRYMVVDTRNWLPGRKVLVAPLWVTGFDWARTIASVNLSTAQIEESPEYRANMPIDRAYETSLHDHYDRPAYWETRGL